MPTKKVKRTIVVKVTESQYKEIKEKARKDYLQVATWVRKRILEK